ncbi:MAG: hypothetical protein IJX37_00305 [Oscillospiraceae bacterium]|nr:hypothetical protein [Oscillospiraceae bacterium]
MDIVRSAGFLPGVLNILSVLLGLVSLGFGVNSFDKKGSLTFCTVSLGCCGGAVLAQLLELSRLAKSNDWAAIQDTVGARAGAAAVLLIAALGLNVFALLRGQKKKD